MEFLLSGFPYVPSSGQLLRSCWHTLGIKKASLLCGSSHVSSSCMLERMPYYNWSIWIAFLLCGSSHEYKWSNFEKFLVHVLHLNCFFWLKAHFECFPLYSKKHFIAQHMPLRRGEGGRALSVKKVWKSLIDGTFRWRWIKIDLIQAFYMVSTTTCQNFSLQRPTA